MEDYKTGDIVQLKSGGPKMTVRNVDSRFVDCQWFAGSKLEAGKFPKDSISLVKDEKPKKEKP